MAFFTNDELIDMLVENDSNSIMCGDATELLHSYLEFGHKGYREYSEFDLIQECRERDLIPNYPDFTTANYKTVRNYMTGKYIAILKDTPWECSPASESYWSN